MTKHLVGLGIVILGLSSSVSATTYEIDPTHTGVNFSVRHMMVSNVRGGFSDVSGTVDYDPKNPESTKIEAKIAAKSIDTRLAKRDEHLRGEDFFNVTKNEWLTFKSKSAKADGGGKLKVKGDLTINGVTKEVELEVAEITNEVKDFMGNTKMGASATAKINRKDFGLTWNKAIEAGGVAVGDDVSITIDVELQKKG